ncbi:MAG TPA: 3-hydroxyacyl-CoA dehydrogenase, partial [Sphingobium sp.]|nr:3-hydroxyacyl-CoA dehydrogenase [Sphingobium sp.]
RAGGGFYDYPDGGSKHIWKGLAEHFPVAVQQPDQDELKQRFLFAQAMETARCLEEGVLETPQDADLGAVYGWGFPLWTGGTISYIDMVGIGEFVARADELARKYGDRFLPSAWLRDKAERREDFYGEAAPVRDREMA